MYQRVTEFPVHRVLAEHLVQVVEDLGHLGLGSAPGLLENDFFSRRHSAPLPQRIGLRSLVVSQSCVSNLSDVLKCRAGS